MNLGIDFADVVGTYDVTKAFYYARAMEFSPWIEEENYQPGELDAPKLIESLANVGLTLLHFKKERQSRSLVCASDEAVVWISDGSWQVSSAEPGLVESLAKLCQAHYTKTEAPEGRVHVTFSYCERNYPSTTLRAIEFPQWESIHSNYAPATQNSLDALMKVNKPEHGRLVVFNGPPGTGKTFAIRSLIGAWDKWARSIYVIDPDEFFRSQNYMLRLLPDPDDSEPNEESKPDEKPYTVFLFDDADEYLAADSKEKKGQEISRFLNVLDGFIGQGLNIIFILTTNQGIEKLNEAAIRPGRCLANIQFERFDESSAKKWLANQGYEGELPASKQGLGIRLSRETQGSYSLAELYSCINRNTLTD